MAVGIGILHVFTQLYPVVEKGKLGIAPDGEPLKTGVFIGPFLFERTAAYRIGSVVAATKDAQLIILHRRVPRNSLEPVGTGMDGLGDLIKLSGVHDVVIFGGVGIRGRDLMPGGGSRYKVFGQRRMVGVRPIIRTGGFSRSRFFSRIFKTRVNILTKLHRVQELGKATAIRLLRTVIRIERDFGRTFYTF